MRPWSFTIPDFLPATANQLLARVGSHGRLKRSDHELVAWYGRQLVPDATGKRRVSVLFVYPRGQRMADVDARRKSLLDALKQAGLIVNDSPKWCVLGEWSSERGDRRATILSLEDL
jgi:hypothetical protein